ncbi:MAG: DUF2726 domain-containing protein [Leadbetterella sp.]|nr:DUF2726 domain-containing protein [Leadbetterella sp.]
MLWTIILIVFIVAVAIAKIFIERKERELDIASYQKKNRVMNESEQALFINLQKALGDTHIVLSKVRIEDFVEVNKEKAHSYKNHWGLRGRIKSRHVDFLVCDRASTKPLLAIELDGKSHNGKQRQERDHFVDELYKAINLPIEHISVGGNFLELSQKIKETLNGETNQEKI